MNQHILLPGDAIGIIAPSRPIYNIKKEIDAGILALEQLGFKVKQGKNIDKRFFYSAGTPEERVSDIHEMFADSEVKAIICATGGSSANQLLELIDFELIKNNPKIFMGYSDITVLLLAMYKRSGLPVIYGPTIYEMSTLTADAKNFLFKLLNGKEEEFKYPSEMKVVRPGKASGKLVGGLLSLINSSIVTGDEPDFSGGILFWEEVNSSPAMLDFNLQALRLAGVFEKINGMVIGHLSGCDDKKYPQDNRPIEDIVLEKTAGFNFPIIKVDYFGHDINDFYAIPIGDNCEIDTEKSEFKIN